MQEPGCHHRDGELHCLGRLEANAEVEPTARALADVTLGEDQHQQHESCEITPRCPASQEVGWELRHDQHRDKSDTQAHQLVHEQPIALANGAVENEQAEAASQQQADKQRSVDMQPPHEPAEV